MYFLRLLFTIFGLWAIKFGLWTEPCSGVDQSVLWTGVYWSWVLTGVDHGPQCIVYGSGPL